MSRLNLPTLGSHRGFTTGTRFKAAIRRKASVRNTLAATCVVIASAWTWHAGAQPSVEDYLARAMAGDIVAQMSLAKAHTTGEGAVQDPRRGMAWVVVAAASGDRSAIRVRDAMMARAEKDDAIAAQVLGYQALRTIVARTDQDTAPGDDIFYIAATGPRGMLADRLKRGAKVNARTSSGITPLTVALRAGRYDLARMLLEAGARTEVKTPTGLTLLADAARRKDARAVELLVKHGASVFADDGLGAPLFQSEFAKGKAGRFLAIENRELTRLEAREIQARLAAIGLKPGAIDGVIGEKTWRAFDEFSARHGFKLADRNANAALEAVRRFVPMSKYRDRISAALRADKAAAPATASRPQAPAKTAAQIFWGN